MCISVPPCKTKGPINKNAHYLFFQSLLFLLAWVQFPMNSKLPMLVLLAIALGCLAVEGQSTCKIGMYLRCGNPAAYTFHNGNVTNDPTTGCSHWWCGNTGPFLRLSLLSYNSTSNTVSLYQVLYTHQSSLLFKNSLVVSMMIQSVLLEAKTP